MLVNNNCEFLKCARNREDENIKSIFKSISFRKIKQRIWLNILMMIFFH
jgi:hypothetical protein